MKTAQRITALALIITLALLSLFGCDLDSTQDTTTTKEDVSNVVDSPQELKLPFSKNDTLDPYRAKSILNQQISSLMFDSLFTVDSNYNAKGVIAEKYGYNELDITVTIKKGIAFRDMTEITAQDIVYSFKQAKGSPNYSARLQEFSNAEAVGNYDVSFTLSNANPFAVSNLIFPIVKLGTVSGEIDGADIQQVPIGSGRYILKHDNEGFFMKANPSRLVSYYTKTETLRLVNITDNEAMPYSLEIGTINFMFDDLSEGIYRRMNASTVEVTLNNLVYIVFNKANYTLSDQNVRKAINKLIDREEIALSAFQGHAVSTQTPFNPNWSVVEGQSFDEQGANEEKSAIEVLEDAGYKSINSTRIRYGGNGSLSFNLIVNKENEFKCVAAESIAQQLGNANISITVEKLAREDYEKAVKSGKYDIYLGEIRLTPSMNLRPMLALNGAVSFGIDTMSLVSDAYTQFLSGSININEFMKVFNENLPFVPLCFRNGIAACSRSIITPLESSATDVYFSIDTWSF